MAAAAGTKLFRSAATKIARASPLHPCGLLALGHRRPSSGPALPPVPTSSSHCFSSSSSESMPPLTKKDIHNHNSKVPSETECARAKSMHRSLRDAYMMMLGGLVVFSSAKFSLYVSSRQRDDLKYECQMIHDVLDNNSAGGSMQTREQGKKHAA